MLPPPDDRRRPPDDDANGRSFSPNLRRLFLCMRQKGYGTFRGVHFRDGDPLFDPPFDVIRKVRTAEKVWPHRNSVAGEFVLSSEHRRFIDELAATGSGVVDIKVVNGLPVDLDIHERS
jgi:hypothetical protein